jgi:hypothetical protein
MEYHTNITEEREVELAELLKHAEEQESFLDVANHEDAEHIVALWRQQSQEPGWNQPARWLIEEVEELAQEEIWPREVEA